MLTRVAAGAKERSVALPSRWRLKTRAPFGQFDIHAEHDPLLDGMVLDARAGTSWLRLLYDLTPQVAEGGLFRIDLHLRQLEGAPVEWVALLRQDAAGDQRFQHRATPGAAATGRVSLTAGIPPAEAGIFYLLGVSINAFPARLAVSAVGCLRLGDYVDGAEPVPADRRAGERGAAEGDGASRVQRYLWEEYYAHTAGLPEDAPLGAVVAHYLDRGAARGLRPNPLFDEMLYRRQVTRLGLPALAAEEDAFAHWLDVGRARGIVPTALFDAAEYRELNAVPAGIDAYDHYLTVGFRRDFSPSQFFDARWYARRHAVDARLPAIVHYATVGAAAGFAPAADIPPLPPGGDGAGGLPLERFAAQLRARADALGEAEMRALVARAALIEPQIMRPLGARRLTWAPGKHSSARAAYAGERVRAHLAGRRFDTLILVPHCRLAGSARVAGALGHALAALRPDERILIVSTERADFERADWFPPSAELLNLPALLAADQPDDMVPVLLDLARGLAPKRLFNVNSGSGWRLLARYGRQLAVDMALYSYLFTWDLDEAGTRVGYPVSALPLTFDHLDAVLLDNQVLGRELADRYALAAEAAARRLPVLWSPGEPSDDDWHDRFGRRGDGRPRCLWAGRFDRQKRLDLVLALARARPDLDFHVYGKPVLGDTSVPLDDLPPNVALKGIYASLEELDLGQYDLFLYTAAWDGLPTILIDMALRGLAVVASAVGGVVDLIDGETGWPVADWDEPAAYAAAIDAMHADPAEVHARAARLRARARDRHDGRCFGDALAALLRRDERRPAERVA